MPTLQASPEVTRLDDYRQARRGNTAPSDHQKLYEDLSSIADHIIQVADILSQLKIPTRTS
jgi:hypothetical protein